MIKNLYAEICKYYTAIDDLGENIAHVCILYD